MNKPKLSEAQWLAFGWALAERVGIQRLVTMLISDLGSERTLALLSGRRVDIDKAETMGLVKGLLAIVDVQVLLQLAIVTLGLDKVREIIAYIDHYLDEPEYPYVPIPDVSGARPQLVTVDGRRDLKASSVHTIDDGSAVIATYDSDNRGQAWLVRVWPDGRKEQVYNGRGVETFGFADVHEDGYYYLPAERPNGRIVRLRKSDGKVEETGFQQPHEYASRTVEGHTCYIPRGRGVLPNELWNIVDGVDTGIRFPRLSGIVSGLVRHNGHWIASVIDKGIESTEGWHIPEGCPEITILQGELVAFLRDGRIFTVRGGRLGREIANTRQKPQRVVRTGADWCWMMTANKDQLWLVTLAGASLVHDFGGADDPTSDGALFDTSIALHADGSLALVRSIKGKGIELYRLIAGSGAANPQPVSHPAPVPAEKILFEGIDYRGTGAFNTFKDMGRESVNPARLLRFMCRFRVDEWSGGGSAQPAGAVLVCKGLVGQHWTFAIVAQPNGIKFGMTNDEVLAPVVLKTGQEYHLNVLVESGGHFRFWLDDQELKHRGRVTNRGLVFHPGAQPIRLGGWYNQWLEALWYNLCLNGEIKAAQLSVI